MKGLAELSNFMKYIIKLSRKCLIQNHTDAIRIRIKIYYAVSISMYQKVK